MRGKADSLRVLTWNIHGCIGLDRRFDPIRTGTVLRGLIPDIAAIQEVDLRRKTAIFPDINLYLQSLIGDHAHQAWTVSNNTGDYGQILASRFPLTDSKVHDISLPGCEPRKIIETTVLHTAGRLRVMATHLGFWNKEGDYQLDRLRDIVMTDLSSPLLLLGDFNVWRNIRNRHDLFKLFEMQSTHRSFPSLLPVLALDRIMCRGGARLLESRAVQEARLVSDHLPVLASIDPGCN